MTISPPAFASDLAYGPDILRKQMSTIVSAGVVASGDMAVSPQSGLQVQVSAGQAYVQQTVSTEGSAYSGLYYVINDATAVPANTITAPTVNPRIDQIVLRVYDVTEQSLTGASFAQYEWVKGTETSGATLTNLSGAAALPANSLRLAYILQTVGESSISSGNISNVIAPYRSLFGLTPIPISSSMTASVGNLYLPNAPLTLTLPSAALSPPVPIGVFATGGVTGVSPVIITSVSTLYGVGPTSTSMSFGAGGQCVVFMPVGANWCVISGHADTGWVSLSLNSGVTAIGGEPFPAARLVGDVVKLRGAVAVPSGSPVSIATLPAACRPASTTVLGVGSDVGGSVGAATLNISTAGAMTPSVAGANVYLNGITFASV